MADDGDLRSERYQSRLRELEGKIAEYDALIEQLKQTVAMKHFDDLHEGLQDDGYGTLRHLRAELIGSALHLEMVWHNRLTPQLEEVVRSRIEAAKAYQQDIVLRPQGYAEWKRAITAIGLFSSHSHTGGFRDGELRWVRNDLALRWDCLLLHNGCWFLCGSLSDQEVAEQIATTSLDPLLVPLYSGAGMPTVERIAQTFQFPGDVLNA